MEPRTESADVTERDSDYACFVKAKDNHEPTFTLRAQDISADLCVDFWISAQLEVRQHIDDGMTVQEAVETVRKEYRIAPWGSMAALNDPKLTGAIAIAKAMRAFPNRKVAD